MVWVSVPWEVRIYFGDPEGGDPADTSTPAFGSLGSQEPAEHGSSSGQGRAYHQTRHWPDHGASPALRRRAGRQAAVEPSRGASQGAYVVPPGEHASALLRARGRLGSTSDYSGLRLKSPEAVGGGAADPGLVALARQLQKSDPNVDVFSAINDNYHHGLVYHSKHTEGLAFDVTMKNGDYDAARSRMRSHLDTQGMHEGSDYYIEPGTYNHMHVGFQSHEAAAKYRNRIEPHVPLKAPSKASYLEATMKAASASSPAPSTDNETK